LAYSFVRKICKKELFFVKRKYLKVS